MTTGLVDTHCHLMDRAFDADRDAVLLRAREAGVGSFILVGYDLLTSRLAIELAQQLPYARATVGIHPNASGAASEQDFEAIEELSNDPLVVGIGETGLDYYRDRTPPDRQREAFQWHLELAAKRQLPVITHNREADSQIADALENHSGPPGVLHCFSSSDPTFARRMLDAGYYFSLAGPVTYPSSASLREVVKTLPCERILVETDCPYLPPQSKRGRRNEPAYMVETATRIAEITLADDEELREQLWSNTLRVFPALGSAA